MNARTKLSTQVAPTLVNSVANVVIDVALASPTYFAKSTSDLNAVIASLIAAESTPDID